MPVDHGPRVEALRRAVFESGGVTDRATRKAAATGDDMPAPMGPYLAKVRDASYRVTDADVAGLRAAGHGEEEIFELTVAAALGRALHGLECGRRAMELGD